MTDTLPELPEGYQVPVYRSLTQPSTLGGLPRMWLAVELTATAVLAILSESAAVIVLGLVAHLSSVRVARRDPYALEHLLAYLFRQKDRLEV